jgi:hypothetical protein
VLSTLSVFGTGVAAQQPVPGADEMHSMYCVEVIRAEIDLQHHMISASDDAAGNAVTPQLRQQWIDTSSELLQGLARLELLRYRLQSYMLPRMQALDAFALAAAIRQGDADFEASRALADHCTAECVTLQPQTTNGPQATQGPQACAASCGDSDALTRVSACQNPTWLPAERGATPADTRH